MPVKRTSFGKIKDVLFLNGMSFAAGSVSLNLWKYDSNAFCSMGTPTALAVKIATVEGVISLSFVSE